MVGLGAQLSKFRPHLLVIIIHTYMYLRIFNITIIIRGASLSELVSRACRSSHRYRIDDAVGNRWVLLQGLTAAGAGVRVIGADEACKLWPLEVGCTVCEEDGGQTNCVYHGNEVAALLESVLPGLVPCREVA